MRREELEPKPLVRTQSKHSRGGRYIPIMPGDPINPVGSVDAEALTVELQQIKALGRGGTRGRRT